MTEFSTDMLLQRVQELLTYNSNSPLIFNSGLFLFLFVGFAAGYAIYLLTKKTRKGK